MSDLTARSIWFFIQEIILISSCLLHCSSSICEASPELLVLEKDNDRTLEIRQDETVRISLTENATTGYRWAIDRYDSEFIEAVAVEPSYRANPVGSGGEVGFIFKCKKIGSGQILLKQWRSWEGEASIIKRFNLRLNIWQP